jgi:hypothetical protein
VALLAAAYPDLSTLQLSPTVGVLTDDIHRRTKGTRGTGPVTAAGGAGSLLPLTLDDADASNHVE